jgi:hypothetical protein
MVDFIEITTKTVHPSKTYLEIHIKILDNVEINLGVLNRKEIEELKSELQKCIEELS